MTEPPSPRIDPITSIAAVFAARGGSQYGGEVVTQQEHALQAATLALGEDAGDEFVVAALLHDLGHLFHALPVDAPDAGVDDRHEATAARRLAAWFGPGVCEPVRLHVEAKRYLVAVDPVYRSLLSGPSITSLGLQGGPMSPVECGAFERLPHATAAVRLRRWDDAAKVPGAVTPPLSDFLLIVGRVLAIRS